MEDEAPTCYVCMDEESSVNPFLTKPMCECSTKPDSTLKVHQLCLELARDHTGKCGVCKTALSNQWAFDEPFVVRNEAAVQYENNVKHGVYYQLLRTGAGVGPIRYLAGKGTYKQGRFDGPQYSYAQNGTTTTETNYCEGVRHGLTIRRNKDDKVLLEENYVDGKRHGLYKEVLCGYELKGTYVMGVKVGVHYEIGVWPNSVRRAEYKNGKLDGQLVVFDVECGEGLPLLEAQYLTGDLHGVKREYRVNKESLERRLVSETHYTCGLRNGRRLEYDDNGLLKHEAFYDMDKVHGTLKWFEEGKPYYEITYEAGVKNGPVRKWLDDKLIIDAEYKNGFRHGRFIEDKSYQTVSANYWSDGTVELLDGEREIKWLAGRKVVGNYKMGVRHGTFTAHYGDKCEYKLNFVDGQLDGECVMYTVDGPNHYLFAKGKFAAGVPVGRHVVYNENVLIESVNYNANGQLHGTCLFTAEGKRFQELTFKNGVLHGRQCQFQRSGLPHIVSNMRDGRVHGNLTVFDERGVIITQTVAKDLEVLEILPRGICYPAEITRNGTLRARWTNVEGDILYCESAAVGRACNCLTGDCRAKEEEDRCSCCGYDSDGSVDSHSSYTGRGRRRSRDERW